MNTEGLNLELSAEVVRSTSTGLLFLLLACWLIYGLNRMWRSWMWEQGVYTWSELTGVLGGPIELRRAGWKVVGPNGDLRVRGGLWPVQSRLKLPDGTVHVVAGVADAAWVRARLAEQTE